MAVYISGPMTGYDNYNRPAFFEAEKMLKSQGYEVFNPAKNPDGLTYSQYLDIDMAMVRCSNAIYCLPGCDKSKGAQAEIAYAKSLGLLFI